MVYECYACEVGLHLVMHRQVHNIGLFLIEPLSSS